MAAAWVAEVIRWQRRTTVPLWLCGALLAAAAVAAVTAEFGGELLSRGDDEWFEQRPSWRKGDGDENDPQLYLSEEPEGSNSFYNVDEPALVLIEEGKQCFVLRGSGTYHNRPPEKIAVLYSTAGRS